MYMEQQAIFFPADVPKKEHGVFAKNYTALTLNTDRFFMFSCDQKIEHLNKDFVGKDVHPQALHPEHLFRIASQGKIGAMATHLGLIARYGAIYPHVNYVVKLNAKTDLVTTEQKDPLSALLWNVDDVINFKNSSGLNICGVGLTVYLGSEYESDLLSQAAHIINRAHQVGLVAILWMYPRGKAVMEQDDYVIIAGAAGVAHSLGADIAKIKAPKATEVLTSAQALKIATAGAGNTKLVISGGEKIEVEDILKKLHDHIHIGGAAGCAIGRNIFQRSVSEAVALTQAIYQIVYGGNDYETALAYYKNETAIKK